MSDEPLLWRAGPYVLHCARRTHLMGVINVTPDSFFDGGRFLDPDAAVARGVGMAQEGADVLDVGGESTRPGSLEVPAEEERARVLPVIERLAAEVDIPVSIDTRKREVAEAALHAGATIVNDVTAGADAGMFEAVRSARAGMVLMHMRGEPRTMQQLNEYRDVVTEVRDYLADRLVAAERAGIEPERLAVDPGLGFAKKADQSLQLMREVAAFAWLGRPVLVGPSRKSFVGLATGTELGDRLEGTAAAVAWLAGHGAHVIRVHDVREMVRVVRMVDAIRAGSVESVGADRHGPTPRKGAVTAGEERRPGRT